MLEVTYDTLYKDDDGNPIFGTRKIDANEAAALDGFLKFFKKAAPFSDAIFVDAVAMHLVTSYRQVDDTA